MTASEISADIDASSARSVVNRLLNGHVDAMGQNDWSRTMDQILNGKLAYIALAPKLAKGVSEGTADDLSIALARALPAAPEAVLRVIDRRDGPVLGPSRVCGIPFAGPSTKDVTGYLRAAQAALDDVDTPRLERVRTTCAAQLERAARQWGLRRGN